MSAHNDASDKLVTINLDRLRTIGVGVAHHHTCQSVNEDEMGFWTALCDCGDRTAPPASDLDIVVDMFARHLRVNDPDRRGGVVTVKCGQCGAVSGGLKVWQVGFPHVETCPWIGFPREVPTSRPFPGARRAHR